MKNTKLKIFLLENDKSQKWLATASGISEGYISMAIRGRYVFNQDQKNRIARALGVSQRILKEPSMTREAVKKENAYIPRKRLYTVKESAEYLGHTVWGIRSLIWAKALPVVQNGRKQFVDIFDLDEFITKNKEFVK